jgi:hypothetical protein
MAISYRNSNKINRIIEPLYQIDRVKLKSPRSSLMENLESNLLKIDFSRILKHLDEIDDSILDKITYFVGDITDYTEQARLDDGIAYDFPGIQTYIDEASPALEELTIDTTNKLSGKLSRLINKVSRLENGE